VFVRCFAPPNWPYTAEVARATGVNTSQINDSMLREWPWTVVVILSRRKELKLGVTPDHRNRVWTIVAPHWVWPCCFSGNLATGVVPVWRTSLMRVPYEWPFARGGISCHLNDPVPLECLHANGVKSCHLEDLLLLSQAAEGKLSECPEWVLSVVNKINKKFPFKNSSRHI
jgi:hypothetical protein